MAPRLTCQRSSSSSSPAQQQRQDDDPADQAVGEAAMHRERLPRDPAEEDVDVGRVGAEDQRGEALARLVLEPRLAERPAGERMGEIVQLAPTISWGGTSEAGGGLRRTPPPPSASLPAMTEDLLLTARGSFSTCQVWPLATSAWRSAVLPSAAARVLLDDRAFEGRRGVVVDHAQRHREARAASRSACARPPRFLGSWTMTAGIVGASTTLSFSASRSSARPLLAAGEQHRLARLEPELLARPRRRLVGEAARTRRHCRRCNSGRSRRSWRPCGRGRP